MAVVPRFCEVINGVSGGLAIIMFAGVMAGCPHAGVAPKVQPPAATLEEPAESTLVHVVARRQTSYARLNLPQVMVGMKIRVGALPSGVTASVWSVRLNRSEVVSPLADQLLGSPELSADTGSYLWPLPRDEKAEKIQAL